MHRTLRRAAALLALSMVLFTSMAPTAGMASDPGPAMRAIASDAVALPTPEDRTALPGGTPLHLVVALTPANDSALQLLLAELSTPTAPEYGHFLTRGEFDARYEPSAAAASAVASYFAAEGASRVSVGPDRLSVAFDLPADRLGPALGLAAWGVGSSGGRVIYTAPGAPELPESLRALVSGIGGLSDLPNSGYLAELRAVGDAARLGHARPEYVLGMGGQPWFVGSDITQASGTSALFPGSGFLNATFPTHEAVATLLMSAYNQTNGTNLPPFDPVAVQQYFNDTFPSNWPYPVVHGVPVTVDGLTPPPPGYFNGSNDTSLDEAENSLDLEMAGSMAPGAQLVNFYFAGSILGSSSSTASNGDVADDFALTLETALAYNYTNASLVAVTASFGLPDLNDSLWDSELQEAAARGVTVLAASGDQGDAPPDLSGRFQGQWPVWPATAAFDSFGDVSVGGLMMGLSGVANGTYYSNGTLNASFDPSAGSYVSPSAWYDTAGGFGNYSGTEGGASSVYAEPGWQLVSAAQPTIVNATVEQGATSLGRAGPDVAFPASAMIAYVARDSGGIYYAVLEGTSIASPLMAGQLASIAAVQGRAFGFLTPTLYRMGSFFAEDPLAVDDPFIDVTNGSNYVFSAGPGWDATTGWGTLYAPWLLTAFANPVIVRYNYTGPTPGLPTLGLNYATPPTWWLLVLIVGAVALAIVAIAVTLRPRPGTPPSGDALDPGAPYGVQAFPAPPGMRPGPLPPAAPAWGMGVPAPTFLCPYCGHPRPAEPVRCPTCGRF